MIDSAFSLLSMPIRWAYGQALATPRRGVEAAGAAVRAAGRGAALARRGAGSAMGTARALPRETGAMSRAVFDLHRRRRQRRAWADHGRAHIEVRGLDRAGGRPRRVTAGVTRALRRLRGVHWAELNAVTGQVLVAFDEDRQDLGTLLDTVRGVEEVHGTRGDDFSWDQPIRPGDRTPIAMAAIELAADCVAVTTAAAAKLLRLPPLPRGVRLAIALVEVEGGLRRRLGRRVGPVESDLVISLANAALHGLSGGVATPLVDSAYRVLLLAETWERRRVWERREGELSAAPASVPGRPPARPPRPRPLPRGPIEEWSDRLGPAAPAAAAAVLGLTRDAGRAADAILAAVPKAATYGRGAFAAVVGGGLARRHVLPLNATVFRQLDRVSAVVFDSAVLCSDRPRVLDAEAAPGGDPSTVWQAATRVLSGLPAAGLDGTGPWRYGERYLLERAPGMDERTLAVYERGRRIGTATVGRELAPLADAVLDAAGSIGAAVLLTDEPSVADLVARADEVLDAADSLTEHVRRLQDNGAAVLVVSATDAHALAAADVGIALAAGGEATWSADLVCSGDLADVWRVLHAATAARGVSENAVLLAQAGSALSALLALVGDRRARGPFGLAPVLAAGAVAMARGAVTGARVVRAPVPAPFVRVPWYAFDAAEVFARLRPAVPDETGGPDGSDPIAVAWHLAASTAREIAAALAAAPVVAPVARTARAGASLAGAVREELQDPLTPVLAVGAAASAIVGSGVDAVLVASVMAGNALVSGAQRLRADRALRVLLMDQAVSAVRIRAGHLDHLDRLDRESRDAASSSDATGGGAAATEAGRDGDEHAERLARLEALLRRALVDRVPARELAPGDVIRLRAADLVPADARLLATAELEVDESTLTGESVPVIKDVAPTPGAPLAGRSCMVYEGTSVLAGSAYAVVVATGESTEAGRAVRAAGRRNRAAGVQARLSDLTRIALPVTGFGGAAVTGLGLLRGLRLRQAVAAGISVAVASVPEGLPLVATVAQAAAARRLSRRAALVRASRTIEALGRVDTVCFDKTGTLTVGRLAVSRVAGPGGPLETGDPDARAILAAAGRACPPGPIGEVPHATDRAVLEAAVRAGDVHRAGWRLAAELPFETGRGYAAALGTAGDAPLLVVKGAPETVLALCGGDPEAERTVRRLAADGLRVLAVAQRTAGLPAGTDDVEALVADLTLLGFVGMADAPRPDAAAAVRELRDSGVRVVMVTGDHPVTARAVAHELGIAEDGVLTGPDLDRMTESERVRRVAESTVFARVSPEHKVRIVDALQRAGRVVAMTGDGINDAAAIRLADVGIGVAARGSSSARTAADLVLADADVRRVQLALLEGRALWRRVGDAVSILLGGNAGEVAFMVIGTALAGRAPITTRQMLLVNMLTDMFPALAVALAPRRDHEDDGGGPVTAVLGEPLARAVAVRGAATALAAIVAWTVGRFTGRRARAGSMGLAALVATQLGQTLAAGRHSRLVVVTSVASFAALIAIVQTPVVSHFFGSTPLGPVAWAVVLAAAAAATAVAALWPRLLPGEAIGALAAPRPART